MVWKWIAEKPEWTIRYKCYYRGNASDWGNYPSEKTIGGFKEYNLKKFQDTAPSGWEIISITRYPEFDDEEDKE